MPDSTSSDPVLITGGGGFIGGHLVGELLRQGWDVRLIRETHGWEPSISLREGLEKTYAWVFAQVEQALAARPS